MFICSTKFIQIQMQIKFIQYSMHARWQLALAPPPPKLRTAPCPRCGGGGLQLLQLQVVVVQLHAGSRPIGHGSR